MTTHKNKLTILVFSDIHGNIDMLSKVVNDVDVKPDIVVCPGDFTDMFDIVEGFSHFDVIDLIIQKLMSFRCPLLCVPGNHDPYEIVKMFEKYNINLHGKKKEMDGFTFIGWGGAATPFNTYFEPTENETKGFLDKIYNKEKNIILIVHNPPKNTKLDMVSSGQHVGSSAIRNFITNKKPILCISAHIHEAFGIDKIGNTMLFFPGPVYNGNYGVVVIEGNKISCKIKTVK